ncbi:MAG: YIP1 family protein [Bacteroidota bacterium]|nr:YIP1 family protein [Bacteroidota bacterium]
MEEQNTVASQAESTAAEMSFSDKLMNVFASPGELFEYVSKAPKQTSNWAIPLLLTIVIGIVFTFVAFTQPPIQDEMARQRDKYTQQQIAAGKMTQEQADMIAERSPKPGSPMFLIFGAVGVVVVMFATLFLSALAFWLLGKVGFKSSATYGKTAEVVGLSMYVMALGSILTLILVVAMGSLHATPSLALAVSDFDPMNKMHKLLASINIMTFWYLGIVAVGLGKLFAVSFGKVLSGVAVIWAAWTVITLFLNFGF